METMIVFILVALFFAILSCMCFFKPHYMWGKNLIPGISLMFGDQPVSDKVKRIICYTMGSFIGLISLGMVGVLVYSIFR